MKAILGKKLGMTRHFDQNGNHVPATLIEAGPCKVVQIKSMDKDGYDAVQVGYQEQMEKRVTKPLLKHFEKANVKPQKILKEFRDFEGDVKVGDDINVDLFNVGEKVKITGLSKGRGFAGVVKRYNFGGGPKTHGQSDRHRTPGSIGQSAWPKRVMKGLRMAGHMGNETVTIRNLEVLRVIPEKNQILVKGSVPGARNGILEIKQ